MPQVHDLRETRLYQEVREECLQEGIDIGEEKCIARAIANMAESNLTVEEIAKLLKMDVEQVRKALATT